MSWCCWHSRKLMKYQYILLSYVWESPNIGCLQVQTQTWPPLGPNPVKTSLPRFPLHLTPTARTPFCQSKSPPHVTSSVAMVMVPASQKGKWRAVSAQPVTRESSVSILILDEAGLPWSSVSSAALFYWWLQVLFSSKGTEEECWVILRPVGN